jgi:hypothetical protein
MKTMELLRAVACGERSAREVCAAALVSGRQRRKDPQGAIVGRTATGAQCAAAARA